MASFKEAVAFVAMEISPSPLNKYMKLFERASKIRKKNCCSVLFIDLCVVFFYKPIKPLVFKNFTITYNHLFQKRNIVNFIQTLRLSVLSISAYSCATITHILLYSMYRNCHCTGILHLDVLLHPT